VLDLVIPIVIGHTQLEVTREGIVTMDAPREPDARRMRVWALAQALKAHGYHAEVAESEPVVVVMASSGSPVVIRCQSRDGCGDELWFRVAGRGAWLAVADDMHLQNAVVAIKGLVPARSVRES
jgi:hypothetical protein